MTSEEPKYKRWETASGYLPPIVVRYGDYGWQTAVKIGDQWLPCEYLRVEYTPQDRHASVTLRIPGHITFERVGPGGPAADDNGPQR